MIINANTHANATSRFRPTCPIPCSTNLPPRIPLHALLKPHATPPKNIQRAPNRQVHLPATQPLHPVQILEAPPAAGVRDGDGAPLSQLLDEGLVDALLEAFVVGGVDEEFRTIRLEGRYCF